MHINEAAIVGQTFTTPGDVTNSEYVCIGYGQNDTFLIVGCFFDAPNNRTLLKTFKLSDVKFKGQLTPKVS